MDLLEGLQPLKPPASAKPAGCFPLYLAKLIWATGWATSFQQGVTHTIRGWPLHVETSERQTHDYKGNRAGDIFLPRSP